MNDEYYKLLELVFDSFVIDSPVEIEKGFLLLNKTTREVLLKLNLNILCANTSEISSVTVNIENLDDEGKRISEINNPSSFIYRDIFLLEDKAFGSGNPITLDPRVRKVKAWISKVVFLDSKVWLPPKKEVKPPEQILVNSLRPELLEQLSRDIRSFTPLSKERVALFPEQLEDYWLCTCGRPNKNDTGECCRCGISRGEVLKIINEENLQKNLEKYKKNLHLEKEKIRLEKEQARILEEEKIKQREKEKHSHSKRNKIISIIGGSFVAFLLLFLLVILPVINYSLASNFLTKKDYNSAIYMFYSLGNYRDSEEMIKEANYLKAKNLLAEKQYDESIIVFSYIENYSDSRELINEANYQIAYDYLANKEYDEALVIFSEIEDYKDSSEMINEANYQKAKDLLSKNQYELAVSIFTKINNFKDSNKLINEANYLLGMQFIEKEWWKTAIDILNNVDIIFYPGVGKIIEDAQERLNLENKEKDYKWAIIEASRDNFRSAYYLLVDLNYKDSAELAKEYEKKAFTLRFEGGFTKNIYYRNDFIEVGGTLYGVKLGESKELLYAWYFNNQFNLYTSVVGVTDSKTVYSFIAISDDAYSSSGGANCTVKVINKQTNEQLAEYTVWVYF